MPNNNIDPSDILGIINSIIAALTMFAAYLFIFAPKLLYRDAYFKTCREQLDKVYYPMFEILKPYLFKDISTQAIDEITIRLLEICEKNYILVDSNLLNSLEILQKSKNKYDKEEGYLRVCNKVCKLFNKTRRYLGMPTLSYPYRANHGMFYNKWISFIYLLLYSSLQITLFLFCLLPVLFMLAKLIGTL